jgi:hypothetical protein
MKSLQSVLPASIHQPSADLRVDCPGVVRVPNCPVIRVLGLPTLHVYIVGGVVQGLAVQNTLHQVGMHDVVHSNDDGVNLAGGDESLALLRRHAGVEEDLRVLDEGAEGLEDVEFGCAMLACQNIRSRKETAG